MPILDPTSVKVLLTTRWSGTAFKASTIRRVQSYSIETNIDSDADPWTLELGNPNGDLNAVLVRDNEVRVRIFGAGKGVPYLLTGIMDDASYNEQGNLELSGRDISCIATDSTHFPAIYRGLTAIKIIEQEATLLGMTTKFKLSTNPKGGVKLELTDGSESYWEFWYRMLRRDGKWLWTLPDGTLVGGLLNYSSKNVKYRFVSASIAKRGDILVEAHNVHKSTQSRVGRIGVEWRSQKGTAVGNPPIITIVGDETTRGWKKRPNKIVQDKHARNMDQAVKMGREEIFESKVGAIEVLITVSDPGIIIKQDNMAYLNIPEHNLEGNWYVVGATMRGDAGGFTQDVRLREQKFAVSKRVPEDPTWPPDSVGGSTTGSGSIPGKAAKHMKDHPEWWPCFLSAAQKNRGSFALDLYMATLLAICDHETGFTNIRSNDQNNGSGKTTPAPGDHGVEWYDINQGNPDAAELQAWKTDFANEGGDGILTWDCAVGPMQLFSDSPKRRADDIFKAGYHNEFFGGRWDACSNIEAAAEWLHQWAIRCGLDNGIQNNLWKAVCSYGSGGCTNTVCPYGENIKNRVLNDPNWLALVQDALSSGGSSQPPDPPGSQDASLRKRIVAWAMSAVQNGPPPSYGKYNGGYKNKPGNWPEVMDCSDFVSQCYAWGSNLNSKYDPNQNGWSDGDTHTLAAHGTKVTQESAQTGDLALWIHPGGAIGGDDEHVAIFNENWKGRATGMISHGGGGPPYFTTFGDEDDYHRKKGSISVVHNYID